MQTAVTLVHQGAMPIALHAVRTFARNFSGTHHLRIHSDGSLDASDEAALLAAAGAMPAVIVRPEDRGPLVAQRTTPYPKIRALLARGAYFTKLQIPVCEEVPYFFFDSDIVWLAPVGNLRPSRAPNAFSTESWSWYNGVADETAWIRNRVPRRVNSGFYYLAEEFPFARMEEMLTKGHFDPALPDNTDQEIMAYLYRNMEYYHPDDLKRSRVGRIYPLATETCAALHFPGRMWRNHLGQMDDLANHPIHPVQTIRYQAAVPLTWFEFFKMRAFMAVCTLRCIQELLNMLRRIRNIISFSR
jgi:hypothetical protein